MNTERLFDYLQSKHGATDSFPFDEQTLVMKVGGKMFAIVSLDETPLRVTLKANPEKAIRLREEYPEITPGYHMNKQHWNTIELNGEISPSLIREMIDESYELIVAGLPKAARAELGLEQ